jgi:competence protein ComEA
MISCQGTPTSRASALKATAGVAKSCRFWGMGRTASLFVLAFLSYQVSSASAQQTASKPGVTPEIAKRFPDGPGKATFLRVCSTCHSPMNVMATGQTRQGWEDTITKMAGYGANASDEDFTAILDYLETNFPPQQKIDINKATADQIEKTLKLEPAAAAAIIAYRDKHGEFKSLDDVKQVPGVDTEILDAKKALITFD